MAGDAYHSHLQDTRVQYQYSGFAYTLTPSTVHGHYLVYTVTNNSKKDQYMQVSRKPVPLCDKEGNQIDQFLIDLR